MSVNRSLFVNTRKCTDRRRICPIALDHGLFFSVNDWRMGVNPLFLSRDDDLPLAFLSPFVGHHWRAKQREHEQAQVERPPLTVAENDRDGLPRLCLDDTTSERILTFCFDWRTVQVGPNIITFEPFLARFRRNFAISGGGRHKNRCIATHLN